MQAAGRSAREAKTVAGRSMPATDDEIREKYLEGAPSGKWDSATQQAMAQFQSDHGWQSKVTPDSRALIKLGLGPNYSQAMLNPDGKSTADAMASNTSSAGASRNK